jgi:hypothetical protein
MNKTTSDEDNATPTLQRLQATATLRQRAQ